MIVTVLGGDVTSWLILIALVAGPGLVATILWSPVLAAERLRSLFRELPISSSTLGNYVLIAMGLSLPWLVGSVRALSVIGSHPGPSSGKPLLDVTIVLSTSYVVGLPLIAGIGLPRLGIDWDPAAYGPGTWLLLFVASAWYTTVFAVPLFVLVFIFALPV